MHALAKNMYDLVLARREAGDMMRAGMATQFQQQILLQGSKGSPVGRITLAGLLRNHTGVRDLPPRKLGSYALVYLLRGTGVYGDTTGVRRKLVPGDLLLVFPEIPHWYGPPQGAVWDEFFIVFSGDVFDLWRMAGLLNPASPTCHLEPVDYWLRRLQELVVGEHDSLLQVCSLQHALAEAFEASAGPKEPEWIDRARRLMGEPGNRTAAMVARTLGMSYETFRKRFVAATGVSPAHFRLTKMLDRACSLIVSERATNKQIAERLGFCDEFHFSHRFKQVLGISPAEFRRTLPKEPAPWRLR
jgi:AraC-like DNA-binding protein